jgi:hypothetical protein
MPSGLCLKSVSFSDDALHRSGDLARSAHGRRGATAGITSRDKQGARFAPGTCQGVAFTMLEFDSRPTDPARPEFAMAIAQTQDAAIKNRMGHTT